ncbi:hypothetical protein PVAP13_2NG221106 [Panicum virgatum]|uniref:Uncharacterized protein n=1 Tax=Panicum virgatum TaxID=38727 RepID=A0A8T0VG50_PANVG|nr:hypothetical protein PVAP13_2NG221106 [Panicum virgatum]
MKGNHCGGLAMAMILFSIVLLGCCTSPAQCRLQRLNPQMTNSSTGTSNLVNFSSSEESKISVVLCLMKDPFCKNNCFCCGFSKRCYGTREECGANCPVCNPRCPPQTARGSQGLGAIVNLTLSS